MEAFKSCSQLRALLKVNLSHSSSNISKDNRNIDSKNNSWKTSLKWLTVAMHLPGRERQEKEKETRRRQERDKREARESMDF